MRDASAERVGPLRAREERIAWAFLALPLGILATLVLYPLFYNVWISVHHVTLANLRGEWPWAGWANFRRLAAGRDFLPALLTSIGFSLAATALSLFLGLVSALLLNRPFRGRGLLRGLFLFPFVVPIVAAAFIWRWLLDPEGVVNWALCGAGLLSRPVAFLSERGWAILWVVLFEGWRYFPFVMLLVLARLQAIPAALYESAEIDGAGTWATFRFVTLPELRHVLGVLFLLRLMWTFNKFDDIYLLTSGAAGTRVLPVLVYQLSFGSLRFGLGAAAAMALFAVLVATVSVYVKRVLKW